MAYSSSPSSWKHKPFLKKKPLISQNSQVTILGCGTSTGAPLLTCRCETCLSKNPRNHRLRASIVIQAGRKVFLIDTSPDLRSQALHNKLHWIDAVLYTHPHADHLHGIDELRTYNFLMGRSIPVYANEWTLKEVKKKFGYIFQNTQEGGGKPHLSLHCIEKPTAIGGVKVIPLPVIHGKWEVLGYRIKDIAYITDCSYVPDATLKLLRKLDVLVLDCLRYTNHPTHLNVDQALELAKKIGARRTYFTHMGHEIEYQRFAKSLPRGMFPAYDGLVIKGKG